MITKLNYRSSPQFSSKVKLGMEKARESGRSIGGFKDLTGLKFGKLLVKEPVKDGKRISWKCVCECGNTSTPITSNLLRGKTTSCGCTQGVRKNSPCNLLWHRYKTSALKRNIEFLISRNFFEPLLSKPCYYCLSSPSQKVVQNCPGHPEFTYSGIDRLDNNLGYTVDNCVPCCNLCNKMKSDKSKERFLDSVKSVVVCAKSGDAETRYKQYVKNLADLNKKAKADSPINVLLCDYRLSAKRRNLDFSITKKQAILLFLSNCYYCGKYPKATVRNYPVFAWNGLDRIDNSAGYTLENCVSCCKDCNELKSNRSLDEFLLQINRINKVLAE